MQYHQTALPFNPVSISAIPPPVAAPSTRRTIPKTNHQFKVCVWEPIYNRRERNLGSLRLWQVEAKNRDEAIELAFVDYYYTSNGKELPSDCVIEYVYEADGTWKYFVAFTPTGQAVGKAYLLKIKTYKRQPKDREVWGAAQYLLHRRPAWIESMTLSKS